MFSTFFKSKPKWQHTKATVRLTTIESFSATNPDQQAILENIAVDDPDNTVRCCAITKLLNPAKIGQIAEQDNDADVRTTAQHHLARLLTGEITGGPSAEQRLTEVTKQTNITVLRYLLSHGDNSIKLAALNQLNDGHHLEEVALHHPQARVRALAAERITQAESLQRITRHSKGKDKTVFQISQTKLTRIREQTRRREQRTQRAQELCEAIESLARTEFSPLYPAKLRGITRQWETLSNHLDNDTIVRFDSALKYCKETLTQHQEAIASLEAQAQLRQQLDSCCQTLSQQIDHLTQQSEVDSQHIEILTDLLAQQQQRWDQLTEKSDINASDQRRFEQAKQQLLHYVDATRSLLAHNSLLSQCERQAAQITLPDDAKAMVALQKALNKCIRKTAWPAGLPQPKPLLCAHRALATLTEKERLLRQWQAEQQPKIETALNALSEVIDAGKLQAAEQQLKTLQQLFQNLPEHDLRPYQRQFSQLHANIQELRDWRGFAGVQHKEDLCQRMEALSTQKIAPEEKAILIKQLQDEWKQLGPTGPNRAKALWQRFSEASDRAYEPCREFNRQQSEIRKQNLAIRQATCDQLQHFLTQVDWACIEWSVVEQIIKTAKEEWRRASPVDRKAGKALKNHFDELISQLQIHLQAEYDRNIENKQQLVAQAQALIKHGDLSEAINQAKKLQQQWADIGPTPRTTNQKIWRSFRAACDAIFARRDELRLRQKNQREEQAQQAEQLCNEVVTLSQLDDAALATSGSQLQQLIKQFNALERVPHPLKKRFTQACNEHRDNLTKLAQRRQCTQLTEALRRARICDEVELQLLKGEALDEGQLAQWPSTTELPPALAQRLNTRLTQVQHEAAKGESSRLSAHQEEALKCRQLLCIQAEILAEWESPVEAKEMRIKYQLSHFNQGLPSTQGSSTLQQAWVLTEQWCGSNAVNDETSTRLTQRFSDAINHCISRTAPPLQQQSITPTSVDPAT